MSSLKLLDKQSMAFLWLRIDQVEEIIGEHYSFSLLQKFIEANHRNPNIITTLSLLFERDFVLKSEKWLKLVNKYLEYYQRDIIKVQHQCTDEEVDKHIFKMPNPAEIAQCIPVVYYLKEEQYETKLSFVEWMKLHFSLPQTLRELLDIMELQDKQTVNQQIAKSFMDILKYFNIQGLDFLNGNDDDDDEDNDDDDDEDNDDDDDEDYEEDDDDDDK